ncbi:MAG: adenylosuccinate synthase [Planctomycetota bacterium]
MAEHDTIEGGGPTTENTRRCSTVVGLHWGDEGKGKLVDLLAKEHDAVVRFNGGANAGHSIQIGDERFALHLMPSGVLHPGKRLVIGNGVVVDPEQLLAEIDGLGARNVDTSGLVVSSRAHVVLPYHKDEDGLREAMLQGRAESAKQKQGEIGTTRRGIGPSYAEKTNRSLAVRVGDLLRPEVLREKVAASCEIRHAMFAEFASTDGVPAEALDAEAITERMLAAGQRLRDRITDTVYLLHEMVQRGQRLLFEGANATLLDVDHGTFPFVTSSSTCALGIGPGTGVPPTCLDRVIGVMKAYCTRVGAGPFPTELENATGDAIRERGREYGTTTGRPRRVGWLDLVATRYAAMVNGCTGLAVTMLDVLSGFDELLVCTEYEIDGVKTDRFPADAEALRSVRPIYTRMDGFSGDLSLARSVGELPARARAYLELIEQHAGVPVDIVSVGPERAQTIGL